MQYLKASKGSLYHQGLEQALTLIWLEKPTGIYYWLFNPYLAQEISEGKYGSVLLFGFHCLFVFMLQSMLCYLLHAIITCMHLLNSF